MSSAAPKRFRRVLTRTETKGWHSPTSKYLRDTRRGDILDETLARATAKGCEVYSIHDADELLLIEGQVPAAP